MGTRGPMHAWQMSRSSANRKRRNLSQRQLRNPNPERKRLEMGWAVGCPFGIPDIVGPAGHHARCHLPAGSTDVGSTPVWDAAGRIYGSQKHASCPAGFWFSPKPRKSWVETPPTPVQLLPRRPAFLSRYPCCGLVLWGLPEVGGTRSPFLKVCAVHSEHHRRKGDGRTALTSTMRSSAQFTMSMGLTRPVHAATHRFG